ncbi:hypothetical protein JK358_00835 [Nocardia sp. 2]|uniref:Uncharacterized protein n=1 Tax=Nocardia acididurans TaxID=2802282 RepID=A0ABS1LXS8_9NOCA|nr:hypothetical protein [Nocardia acididurans]MBL1072935.1 hypothetical protein [Nocardia acididurans]
MATGVGLRMADDECVVAIVTSDDAEPEVHFVVRESILHMSEDGDAELGGPKPPEYSHSISGFVSAVGDTAGMRVDDGEAYRAEDLMATAAFCLINLAADRLSGPAEFYATHPDTWPEAYVRALREAMDYLGLKSVVLVSERDLPQPDEDIGRFYAHHAARAALAAVLSTPAGLTPPDPTASTENAAAVTDVLPAVTTAEPAAQAYAYSAAIPAATSAESTTGQSTPASSTRSNRGLYIIAAATAVIGLLLGGLGVAAVLRPSDSTPTPRGEVRSQPSSTADPTPAEVPPPVEPEPTTEPPTVITTIIVVPAPTTTEPPPTTTPQTTTPPPSTSSEPTTTNRRNPRNSRTTSPDVDEQWEDDFPF